MVVDIHIEVDLLEGSPLSRSILSHMKKQRSMSEVSKLCFEEVKTSTFIIIHIQKRHIHHSHFYQL